MVRSVVFFITLAAAGLASVAAAVEREELRDVLLVAQVDVVVTVDGSPLAAARVALDLDGSIGWDEHLGEPSAWTGSDGFVSFSDVVAIGEGAADDRPLEPGPDWQARRVLTGNLRGAVGTPEVRFDFVVPGGQQEASLGFFDLRGRRLAEVRGAGDLELDVPAGLPAGVYFARLSAGDAAPVSHRITSAGARTRTVSARRLSAAEAAAAGWVEVRPAGQKAAAREPHPINIIVTHVDHGTVVQPEQVVAGYNTFTVDMAAGPADAMVLVPAGTFMMGQVNIATPVHEVTLTRDFLIGRREVTNAEYLEALQWAWSQGSLTIASWGSGQGVRQYGQFLLMISQTDDRYEIRFDPALQQFYLHAGTAIDGATGPGVAYPDGYDPADHPVKHVTWYGAACYADWRSQMEGLPPFYNGVWPSWPPPFPDPYEAEGYRLPTEAEWEYAAKYNDDRWYPWGDTAIACERTNHRSGDTYCVGWTLPVGSRPAGDSALGLQDMAGNVFEWVNDWHSLYGNQPLTDPIGGAGSSRVVRGGSWEHWQTTNLLCARRLDAVPGGQASGIGFRLARTRPPAPPEFIVVPAGTFTMGHAGAGEPEREVTLTRSFELGIYEVTNGQYLEALQWAYDQGLVTVDGSFAWQHGQMLVHVALSLPDRLEILFDESSGTFYLHAGTDDTIGQEGWGPGYAYPDGYDPADHPVKHVTWYGAASYCDWRNQMEGLPLTYDGNWNPSASNNPYDAIGYRLPTDAEWERAARYADGRIYPWGDTAPSPCVEANYGVCLGWTAPVGSYPAGRSALGFYDLAGNIQEWVNDVHAELGSDAVVDPIGPEQGQSRVFRGGPLNLGPYYLQSAFRAFNGPDFQAYAHGFRLCRTVQP